MTNDNVCVCCDQPFTGGPTGTRWYTTGAGFSIHEEHGSFKMWLYRPFERNLVAHVPLSHWHPRERRSWAYNAPDLAAVLGFPGFRCHTLKMHPPAFEDFYEGPKRAEFRRNDRDYRVNDYLRFREWDPATETYTGRVAHGVVAHAVYGPDYGIPEGYVMMTLAWGRLPDGGTM